MRKSLLLISLMCMFFFGTYAQRQGVIKVNTSYSGVVEGYDHLCKTVLFVDGKQVGESSELPQTNPNSFSVNIPRGEHRLKVVNMAKNGDTWEEDTIINDYSLDAVFEGSIKLKKALTIELVFDIGQEKTLATLK